MTRATTYLTILLICAVSVAAYASPAKSSSVAWGASLADAELFDLSGHRHTISQVKAKCVVVVFWAFWCDTWKKALPALTELSADRESLDCEIWTVSIDGRWTEQIRPLVEAHRVPFPVLVDDGKLSKRLALRRVPTVLVLDQRRHVVWSHEGYPGNGDLEKAIRQVRDKPVR